MGLVLGIVDLKLAALADKFLVKGMLRQPSDGHNGCFIHFPAQYDGGRGS